MRTVRYCTFYGMALLELLDFYRVSKIRTHMMHIRMIDSVYFEVS